MSFRKQMDRISDSSCKINALYGEWARIHHLSYSKMMILDQIQKRKSCTQKEIVATLSLPKQTVNTIIKELERNGDIHCLQGQNQKEKCITFTEQGKAFAENVFFNMMTLEEHILARIGEHDCEIIASAMEKFANIFEEEISNL